MNIQIVSSFSIGRHLGCFHFFADLNIIVNTRTCIYTYNLCTDIGVFLKDGFLNEGFLNQKIYTFVREG